MERHGHRDTEGSNATAAAPHGKATGSGAATQPVVGDCCVCPGLDLAGLPQESMQHDLHDVTAQVEPKAAGQG